MPHFLDRLHTRWRRRRWRADGAALARFEGRRPLAVVTGASEGIGFAFARRLALSGRPVVMIARDGDRLADARSRLEAEAAGKDIVALPLDLTRSDALSQLDATLDHLGGVADCLVNNAAIGLSGPFAEQSGDALDQLCDLNVRVATALARHVLPGQLARGQGGIIFVASVGAYLPGPFQAAYYASKAYILSLSEALSAETTGYGVTITAVAPGPVETRFHAKMRAEGSAYRLLLPPLAADDVAKAGLAAFKYGRRVVVPGLVNQGLMFGARLLPHPLLVPIARALLAPRAASHGTNRERTD